MKKLVKKLLVAGMLLAAYQGAMAGSMTCTSNGDYNRCMLPGSDKMNVHLARHWGGDCRKQYTWGADSDGIWVDKSCSGVFVWGDSSGGSSYTHSGSYQSDGNHCPGNMDSNSCNYYHEGYNAGRTDRRANMSNAYERYSDRYDSRFEGVFRQGYSAGWN